MWLMAIGLWASAHAAEFEPDIRPGEGVTEARLLSDYFAPLKDTNLDTGVFILDSGLPGATALVFGGTHGNELAGTVAGLVLVESARVSKGRLIVIPYANGSAISVADTRNGIARSHRIVTRSGERFLPYGDRRTDPADQGRDDPEHYLNPPGYRLEDGRESRNLNRTWPGAESGTPTEQLSHALMLLIRQEGVDFNLDMHEAGTPEWQSSLDDDYRPGRNWRLAYTLVAHPRGLEMAAMALLEMEARTGISMKLEESNPTYRGLSHLEIGNASQSLSFLSESPNPGQDRGRENADVIADAKYPLAHRVGLHLGLVVALAEAFALEHEKPLVIEGLPLYDDLVDQGVGAFLQ
jgi:hypothetical protein